MPQPPSVRRPISRLKRVAFGASVMVLGWVVVEVFATGSMYYINSGSPHSIRKLQEAMAITGRLKDSGNETLHPYLGWTMNPQTNDGSKFAGRHVPINSLGFNDEEHGIPKRAGDKLIVAIVGGSVAWQLSVAGEETLIRKLREKPVFRDKKVELIRLAMSGYKQPQQLMSLNYLLSLGAEFDAVVNIDGYNEIALASCENHEQGVFAAYPRMWHARMQDVVDPRVYSLSFRLFQMRARRQQIAADRYNSWYWWSPTLNLIWWFRDKSMEDELIQLATELKDHKTSKGFGFAALGPKQLYQNEAAMFDHLTALWSNCTRQMHLICRSNNIVYLHALQPNQYFPGSKPLSPTEGKDMFVPDQEYGQAIAKGYPLLIRAGENLRKEGVEFHNLTQLFANTEKTIYVDYFCHYNQQGNDMLAEAVGEKLCQAFASLNNLPTESR